MLKMKRIPTPVWARKFKIEFENTEAGEAFFAFAPRFEEVLKFLHDQVEIFVNDPEQTFPDEDGSFPTQSALSGEYYLSDIHYDSTDSKDKRAYFGMSIMVHCVGKREFENQTDLNYLGLETHVYIWRDTGELGFDEGFNTSSI
jgi:hypothetical protein